MRAPRAVSNVCECVRAREGVECRGTCTFLPRSLTAGDEVSAACWFSSGMRVLLHCVKSPKDGVSFGMHLNFTALLQF